MQNAVAYGAGQSSNGSYGAIISSAISQGNPNQFAVGYADATELGSIPSGNVEVMFTLVGDAHLNGADNFSDYSILQNNYNQTLAGALSGSAMIAGGIASAGSTSKAGGSGVTLGTASSSSPTVTYILSINDDGTGHYNDWLFLAWGQYG